MVVSGRSCILGVGLATVASFGKKVEIDAMRHDIMQVYHNNFDRVISSTQPLTVSAVLYFRSSQAQHGDLIDNVYNEVAKKTKKMLKVAAFDCDIPAAKKHCERVGVTGTEPHVQIYPQSPRPAFKYEGEMTEDALLKLLYKLIPSSGINILTEAKAFDEFKKKNPTKPKLILFSDKKKPATMWKGLSTDSVFTRTVEFAYVSVAEAAGDAVAEAAGAKKKKLPAVLMVTRGKNAWYKEKDMSFIALHEWINVNSESGMGDTVRGADGQHDSAGVEEPEYEKVRELHAKSQHELCFKQKNICGIYLSDGKLDDKVADTINEFESAFAPKGDRGAKYSWMWLDVSVESEFKRTIEEQETRQAAKEDRDVGLFAYPTMIFVKPPKKKREEKMLTYIRMESGQKVDHKTVGAIVEKIGSGATYTRSDLPKFTVRTQAKKAKKEEL